MFMKRWVDISDEVYSLYAKNFYWFLEKSKLFRLDSNPDL